METATYYAKPLEVSRDEVLNDKRFPARLAANPAALWHEFAKDLAELIRANSAVGRKTTVLLDAASLDLRAAARFLNEESVDGSRLLIFLMGEFCDDTQRCVASNSDWSLRSGVRREFVELAKRAGIRPDNVLWPDPAHAGEVGARISEEGGADACFAALGLNGVFAFTGPAAGDEPRDADFFELPGRVVRLFPEARLQAAIDHAGGDLASVPEYATTIGLKQVMQAARVRLYLEKPWQASVLRRAFYGKVTAAYPASILQQHPDLEMVMLPEVADPPRLGF